MDGGHSCGSPRPLQSQRTLPLWHGDTLQFGRACGCVRRETSLDTVQREYHLTPDSPFVEDVPRFGAPHAATEAVPVVGVIHHVPLVAFARAMIGARLRPTVASVVAAAVIFASGITADKMLRGRAGSLDGQAVAHPLTPPSPVVDLRHQPTQVSWSKWLVTGSFPCSHLTASL